ncbi:unnamed protein product [Orchesella dallaii]|uniref:Uncharacterized protein n=1 Tax=Orchesella dallaii TaxID=48710 RepID=A0ABP1S9U2_9HEXA
MIVMIMNEAVSYHHVMPCVCANTKCRVLFSLLSSPSQNSQHSGKNIRNSYGRTCLLALDFGIELKSYQHRYRHREIDFSIPYRTCANKNVNDFCLTTFNYDLLSLYYTLIPPLALTSSS